MNYACLCGNVGSDPKVTSSKSGEAIARFSIATTTKKDAPPQWHSCVAFGKTAEVISTYVRKGTKLLAQGRIEYYTDQESRKTFTSIVCERVEILSWQEVASGVSVPAPSPDMSDVPF